MHREVIKILGIEAFGLILSILGWSIFGSVLFIGAGILFAVTLIGTLFFYRDPDRTVPPGGGIIVAPADGRVVQMSEGVQLSFHDSPLKRISIFLSLWDVHINRAPVSGEVFLLRYRPGCFLPAFLRKSPDANEQNIIGIQTENGPIFVKQIAGLIACRIVNHLNMNDRIHMGDRFGMIRFGSRVEIFMPRSISLAVSEGQKVKAGETIIGVYDEA